MICTRSIDHAHLHCHTRAHHDTHTHTREAPVSARQNRRLHPPPYTPPASGSQSRLRTGASMSRAKPVNTGAARTNARRQNSQVHAAVREGANVLLVAVIADAHLRARASVSTPTHRHTTCARAHNGRLCHFDQVDQLSVAATVAAGHAINLRGSTTHDAAASNSAGRRHARHAPTRDRIPHP
jgi:hypothetical protein